VIHFDEEQNIFYLETKETSYIMLINQYKHLEHIYYGQRIKHPKDINALKMDYEFELGSATSYNKDSKGYMLNHKLLEVSSYGKGDYREPTVHIELPDGTRTLDFTYKSHEIVHNHTVKNMPLSDKDETLKITLEDSLAKVDLCLYYSVYEDVNIITRQLEIINHQEEDIIIDKALSMNLDMLNQSFMLRKLDGAWIRERHVSDHLLTKGILKIDSKKGVSSSDHNPFIMIKEQKATEDYGKVFGFALVYSGNFEINVEISSHDLLRINMGINSFDFRYPLAKETSFFTPEVIMTMSGEGINKASSHFHDFINQYLIPKEHRFKDRPIIINNWEATYFDFNEKKLLAIAKKAKKLGIELFCLDDGWFGKRNDDFSSLGDWHVNKKKIPKGIQHLSRKIRQLGLAFGIWVEPEMVSVDSELYRAHPNWAIKIPHKETSLGRNQLMLDLTNHEVREYIKNSISDVIDQAEVSYVKWDMNRNISDVYSHALDVKSQGKFHHLYVLGLYEILEYLTDKYPHILFESCSSGGNRFDLGMLRYMPQTWTSDNTDAFERLLIQEGTSMCYPLSTISNHVSGERSHQVMRHTPLETRFHVAAFGVLGYELDLRSLTPFDEKVIQKQISFYKEHRKLLQYGEFRRLRTVREGNYTVWLALSPNKEEALLGFFQKRAMPNPSFDKVAIKGLSDGDYKISSRTQYTNIRTFGSLVNEALPIKLKVNHFLHNVIANRYLFALDKFEQYLTNHQLAHSELLLHHMFTGTGYNDNVMLLEDYGSRIFIIKKEKNNEESSPQ